jgi:trk system potassium uptake protein TrkH
MNYKMMGRVSAFILMIEAGFMIPPLIISLCYKEPGSARSFLITIAITAAVALVLEVLTRNPGRMFHAREGLVCVGFSWILLSFFGCLPFMIEGSIPSLVDAMFETVSGFTTTGASILKDVEIVPHGLIYWRSFTHWLGGMGVLVFMLALIPMSGRNDGFTLHLLRAESPGPNVGKMTPKMRQTALILYLIYIGLTALCILFLLAGGMPVFDSFCIAYGTAGTGGFAIKNSSMGDYSAYLQNVVTIFMILFGVNFSCYFLLLRKEWKNVLKDEELRLYLAVIFASIFMITLNILPQIGSFRTAWHHAAFTVASIITTTGYATLDFNKWPTFSKAVLLTLMFIGACAGSTGGGIKVSRVLLLVKGLRRNMHQVLHPQKVQSIRVNGQNMNETVVSNTNEYLTAYVMIVIFSFVILSLNPGFSIESNISAVMCCFNNIGPGLDQVGPASNFSAYSDLSKITLTLDMLLGRLEIFPVLVLFSRSTWKKL